MIPMWGRGGKFQDRSATFLLGILRHLFSPSISSLIGHCFFSFSLCKECFPWTIFVEGLWYNYFFIMSGFYLKFFICWKFVKAGFVLTLFLRRSSIFQKRSSIFQSPLEYFRSIVSREIAVVTEELQNFYLRRRLSDAQ